MGGYNEAASKLIRDHKQCWRLDLYHVLSAMRQSTYHNPKYWCPLKNNNNKIKQIIEIGTYSEQRTEWRM